VVQDKGRRRLFKHRGFGEHVETMWNQGNIIRPVTHEGRASDLDVTNSVFGE